jgi:hypothetical protein
MRHQLTSEADATKPQIIVGNSKRAKELLPEIDLKFKKIREIFLCADSSFV